jgi:hypothetical protein
MTTGVWLAVLTVCTPEQAVPTLAPPQAYRRSPLAILGPFDGVNSPPARTDNVALPVPLVVRTLY